MDLARTKKSLLRWFFPQTCAHCAEDLEGDGPGPLCPDCLKTLSPSGNAGCMRCGVPSGRHRSHCGVCSKSLFACRMIRAAYLYKGPAVSLVHSFKFRGRRAAAVAAGDWMARRFELFPELGDFDAVAPVPLHKSRLTERGYNQADFLAGPVAEALGLPREEFLTRSRRTSPQWSLGRRARKENLKGAFSVRARGEVSGIRILLIDDVATSGTSLEECAKALQNAGARSVAAYVFARQNPGRGA